MSTHDERRRITRVDCTVKGQADYNGKLFQGEIINFSLNGLLFSSDELMDVAAPEKVTITVHWDEEEKDMVSAIQCIVVRKVDHVLGLKFDVIDYDTLMLLKDKLSAKIGDRIDEEFINFMLGSK